MASARTLARIDGLVWTLIYAGLLVLVLGIATGRTSPVAGWSLGVAGCVVAVAGAVLLAWRSTLGEGRDEGAQSGPTTARRP